MARIARTIAAPLALCAALAAGHLPAQDGPRLVTVDYIEGFLNDAGLQACRVEKLNPSISRWHGTVTSIWVEIAPDCSRADPNNADVLHVHQFKTTEQRDTAITQLRNSVPRGVNLNTSVWPIGAYSVVIAIGPHRAKYQDALEAVYRKRQAAGTLMPQQSR